MNIGIVAHVEKAGAQSLLESLLGEFQRSGIEPLLEASTSQLIPGSQAYSIRDLGERCDILVVLGGDGTLLRTAHALQQFTKPLMGINLGSLGFLTCVSSQDYRQAVHHLVHGDYVLSPRTLLHAKVFRQGQIVAASTCLNDAVITRGSLSQLVRMDLTIDGAQLTRYNADGLIIATPTGSTAYSLSANGPVVLPDARVFIVTPICPHVLTNRSVVVGEGSIMEVRPVLDDEAELFLSVDGQQVISLHRGDTVRLSKADMELPLVMLPSQDFSSLLRQKLKWSGSNV